MNIAYIDICRLLELKQAKEYIIDYKCPKCKSEKYHICRSSDYAKCYSCDNKIRLEDMKEEFQAEFELEKQTYKDMMENSKGVC